MNLMRWINRVGITVIFTLLLCGNFAMAEDVKILPVPDGFVSPTDNPTTEAKIVLGKQLFFDRRLSGDGTMSCANCHMPELGFSDGLPISLNYPTTRNWRNSPTLINVAYAVRLFHDGRADTLEEQALFPMMSAFEMNQNLDYLEEELREVEEYVAAFREIFGADIDRYLMAKAISAFERTLVSRNSPLDRFLKGDADAMSEEARLGYELFTGKAECIRCHHGINLSDHKFYALGVPEDHTMINDGRAMITMRFVAKVAGYKDYMNLKEDVGRYLVTSNKSDWKAFRTPTLRDISRSAPYMHNGIFETLDEVIEFHLVGGGKGSIALNLIELNSAERGYLKVFMLEALTGDEIEIEHPRIP